MILDKNRLFDGFSNLADGVDDGRNPSLIDPTQCATADNMVFRGGVPTTRPGLPPCSINFSSVGVHYDVNGYFVGMSGPEGSSAFYFGLFQGACYYSPGYGKPECIMMMASGRLFKLTPQFGIVSGQITNLFVEEIALDKMNFQTNPRAYLVQADRFCIIQDGQSKAIIYDGVVARRAADNEVPVGTIMAYGMGRLIVVVNDFREIEFSDLYGSNSDANDPGAAVLKFTETTFLNEGGTASISFSLGKLSGLHFLPQQDSSVGDGELLAFSEGGITSFQLAIPRDQWKQSAFQRVVLYNTGARGCRSIVSIVEDIWFRSDDGWRSYRQARAEANSWSHLPISTNVRTWTDNDTIQWLDYGSAINFDNRLICTCTPQPNSWRVFHNGLLALDFDILSTFGQSTKPSWDGHWSQVRTQQLVEGSFQGVHRAYVLGLEQTDDPDEGIPSFAVFEITKSDIRDGDTAIPWEVVTRSHDFQSPFNEKELFGADLWVDDVQDVVTISTEYRPDQHPIWTDWQTLPSISPVGTVQAITPGGVPTLIANFFPRRTVEKPENDVDQAAFTGRSMRRGFEFQARIRGTGHCAIRKLRLHAKQLVEDDKAKVP
jgi:hypothetical protein